MVNRVTTVNWKTVNHTYLNEQGEPIATLNM